MVDLSTWSPSSEPTETSSWEPESKAAGSTSLSDWKPSSEMDDPMNQKDTIAAFQGGELVEEGFAPRVQRIIEPDMKGFYGEERTDSVLENVGMEFSEMRDAYVTLGGMLMDNPGDTVVEVAKAFGPAMVESYKRWITAAEEGRFVEALEKYPLQAVQDLTLPVSILFGGAGAVMKGVGTGGAVGARVAQSLSKVAQISNIAGVVSDPIGGTIGYAGQRVVGKAFRKLTGTADKVADTAVDAAERTALEGAIERRLVTDAKMPVEAARQTIEDFKIDPAKFADDPMISNIVNQASEDLKVSNVKLNLDGSLPDNVIDDLANSVVGKTDEAASGITTQNLDMISSDADLNKVIEATKFKYQEELDNFTRGVIPQEEADRVSKMMIQNGFSQDDVMKLKPGDTGNSAEILAVHKIEKDLRTNMTANSWFAKEAPSNVNLAKFRKSIDVWKPVHLRKMGIRAESGRSLNIWKRIPKIDKITEKSLAEIVDTAGGKKSLQDMAQDMATLEADQIANYVTDAYKPTKWDKFREAWYASLLSGLTTQIVNMGSNLGVLAYSQGLENIAASGIGYLSKPIELAFGIKRAPITMAENMGRLRGMGRGFTTATRTAFKTLMTGELPDMMSPLEIGVKRNAIKGKLGYVIRTPLRALEAGDTFFKMMNYASEVEGLAVREALEQVDAGKLAKSEMKKFISDTIADPSQKIKNAAQDISRYNTFTNKLGGDAFTEFGKIIQEARNNKFIGKPIQLLIPFVRTPANIMKFAVERTPFALMLKDTRDAILKGGVARDTALARIGMGTALGWFATDLAMKDRDMFGNNISIVGGMSTDKRERDVQYASGFQPYSIKINDKYYSYARFEPLASIVGIGADFAQLSQKMTSAQYSQNKKDLEKIPAMIAASFAKNLTSKTYLRGLSEGIKAFDDPDRYMSSLAANMGSTVVPTALAQYTRQQDPFLRDARSLIEKIRSRIPGESESLAKRVNMWGEPIKRETKGAFINPIYMSTDKKDKTTEEMIRLEVFPGMPSRRIGGIELTPEQYNSYATMSGQWAKEQLDVYTHDPSWENQNILEKKNILYKVVRMYRKKAQIQMFKMYPDLAAERYRRKQLIMMEGK